MAKGFTVGMRRVVLGSLAALSVVAGSSFVHAQPAAASVFELPKTLYTMEFPDGSGEGQTLRGYCNNMSAALLQGFGVQRAEAQVEGHVRQEGSVWLNRLTCVGYYHLNFPVERLQTTGIRQVAP